MRVPRRTAGALAGRSAGAAVTLLVALGAATLAGCQTGTPEEPAEEPGTTVATTEPQETEPTEPTEPTASADPTTAPAVNGPNTIASPTAGAQVPGPTVVVEGEGTGFEATLLYRVVDADGTDVAEGFTTAGANGEVGPYSFELTLDPGQYTVQVWEPGMGESDEGGEPRNLVEATFTVG